MLLIRDGESTYFPLFTDTNNRAGRISARRRNVTPLYASQLPSPSLLGSRNNAIPVVADVRRLAVDRFEQK